MAFNLDEWISGEEGNAIGRLEILAKLRRALKEAANEDSNLDSMDKRNEDPHPEDRSLDLRSLGPQFPDTGEHSDGSSNTQNAGFPDGSDSLLVVE